MPLNNLSLDELETLSDRLIALKVAGTKLEDAGLDPSFNLSPGERMMITVEAIMPEDAFTQLNQDIANEREDVLERLNNIEDFLRPQVARQRRDEAYREIERQHYAHLREAAATPSTEAAPTPGGVVASSLPEPVDPPPTVEGPVGGDPIPSAPEQSVTGQPETATPVSAPQDDPLPVTRVAEGSGGGQSNGSGSTPPAATHERGFTGTNLWTEEEDARLVELVATGVVKLGLQKKAAIIEAARQLGRPEQSTQFRVYHKLKARIDAAISCLAMDQAQTETPDAGEPPMPSAHAPDGAPGQAEAAAGDQPPAAVRDEADVEPGQREAETTVRAAASIEGQLADAADLDAKSRAAAIAHGNGPDLDPLQRHIDATRVNKDGWTLQRDFDLLDLAIVGWQVNEISLELGMQAKLIKPRLDVLTGLYTDEATGKQVRRFKREAVRDALQVRLTRSAA